MANTHCYRFSQSSSGPHIGIFHEDFKCSRTIPKIWELNRIFLFTSHFICIGLITRILLLPYSVQPLAPYSRIIWNWSNKEEEKREMVKQTKTVTRTKTASQPATKIIISFLHYEGLKSSNKKILRMVEMPSFSAYSCTAEALLLLRRR